MSAFGVERGVVNKGAEKVIGTRGDKRNTKYTAAVLAGTNTTGLMGIHHPAALAAGGAIGASMYHAHRHSPSGAAGIRRSRAAAQKRRATAKEVGPTLRGPVGKSVFGVDLTAGDVVEKSVSRGAALAGGLIAGTAAANEGMRRHYNRKGASVSAKDQYRHPLRSQYAQSGAALRHSAGKYQAKADATGSERAANAANRRRFVSSHRAAEAQAGSLKHYKSLPKDERKNGVYRYDRKKRYAAPSGPIGIGKSAFGVGLTAADVVGAARP